MYSTDHQSYLAILQHKTLLHPPLPNHPHLKLHLTILYPSSPFSSSSNPTLYLHPPRLHYLHPSLLFTFNPSYNSILHTWSFLNPFNLNLYLHPLSLTYPSILHPYPSAPSSTFSTVLQSYPSPSLSTLFTVLHPYLLPPRTLPFS